MKDLTPVKILAVVLIVIAALFLPDVSFGAETLPGTGMVWWMWILILFVFSFFLGIVAVIAGVGGGVLFVPIVGGFFPFHLDFVRGVGLLVALAGALSAGSPLLKSGMANLRLGLPMALLGSISSIFGALVGLALPAAAVQVALGITILGIVVLMVKSKKSTLPQEQNPDCFSRLLGIYGGYYDSYLKQDVNWKVHNTAIGAFLFLIIGFIGGMFGLGAGWANVPVFNLVMGVPLKVSVATSGLVLSINGSAASWIYILKGAVLPLIAVPAITGMMAGSKIGAKLLPKFDPKLIRNIVIGILAIAGLRSLLKGIGV